MAASSYAELGDDDWGRLLSLGAVLRRCAPALRAYATRRAGSKLLDKLHTDMALDAGLAAQQDSDEDVVAYLRRATLVNARKLCAHPDVEPADVRVLGLVCHRLSRRIAHTDPFAELYGRCEAATAQLYGPAWSPPEPFELAAVSVHPRKLDDAYTVGATTAPPADGRGVRLQLCPLDLGPEAFAVLARVLLHELICHVGAGDQDTPDPLSPFAEGLMDWASLHYTRKWALMLCGEYANAAIMHADQSAASFKADFGTRAARDSGEEAALMLLEQHVEDVAVARLAVDLNAAPRPRAPKDEFVRRVLEGSIDAARRPLRQMLDGRTSAETLLDSL